MFKHLLSGLIFISIFYGAHCQQSFEISIDTEEDCIVWQAKMDNTGNVIMVGDIGPYYDLDYDGFIIKIAPDGSYTTKRFDLGDTLSVLSTIDVMDNGQYFVTGSYSIQGNYFERDHFWVILLDQDLNVISQQTYLVKEPYIGYGTPACSLIDNDGNIVITAMAMNEDTDAKTSFSDFAFYKLDQAGDTLLSRYYSYIWDEAPYEFRKMPGSNNFMLIEKSTEFNNHTELMYIDPDLNILQINQFGNNILPGFHDISSDVWLTDTTFLLSGRVSWDTNGTNEFAIGVYEVDTSANFYTELILNKPDTADYPAWRNSMAYANDSTIYIGGFQVYMELWSVQPTVVELYMIDKNMNLLGYKQLGGDANYEVWGIIATDDDGCLVYGTKHDSPEQERDVHIWKVLRDEINIITHVNLVETLNLETRIFPNPFHDKISIELRKDLNWQQTKLSIYSIEGKKVYQKLFSEPGNLLEIDLKNLSSGYYLISIEKNGQIFYNEKILKK